MTDLKFNTSCPVCGRRLLIDLEHLGRKVHCGHCCAGFTARDDFYREGQGSSIDERVEAALRAATLKDVDTRSNEAEFTHRRIYASR